MENTEDTKKPMSIVDTLMWIAEIRDKAYKESRRNIFTKIWYFISENEDLIIRLSALLGAVAVGIIIAIYINK